MIPEKELLAIQDQLKDIEAPRMSLLRDFKMVTDECLRLRNILQFYAEPSNWIIVGDNESQSSVEEDAGKKAREAAGVYPKEANPHAQ